MSVEIVDVGPDHPCDRCGHLSRFHLPPAKGSACMMAGAPVWKVWPEIAFDKRPKATKCWCDGYVRGI